MVETVRNRIIIGSIGNDWIIPDHEMFRLKTLNRVASHARKEQFPHAGLGPYGFNRHQQHQSTLLMTVITKYN